MDAQRFQDHDNAGDKVHRGKQRQAVFRGEGCFTVDLDGFDGTVKIAEFVKDALGVAGGTGRVDGVSRVMHVGLFVSLQRLRPHHFVPVLGVQFKLASAVFSDIFDPFRRVGILHQRPGRAGFPDADHAENRKYAAGQAQEHKVFLADPVIFQVSVYPAAHVVHLGIGDSFSVGFVKQDRFVGSFGNITFKSI